MTARIPFFATCAPGVEPVLHAEAKALKLAKLERQTGGVYFEGSLRDAWRANLWLRTAVRVLLRVRRFPCPDADTLYDEVREVDWSRWLAEDGTLVVDARTSLSALDHSRFIEQRVKDAVVDGFRERTGVRPSVDRETADLGIYAHLSRDRCTLSIDTSGRSLHRRGWRREQGRAPLAETLAAALVLHSGWDGRAPLLDPFCGSGTIPIEAALIATNTAPGLFRKQFGFERWRDHDPVGWQRELTAAESARRQPKRLTIRGSDSDPERVGNARTNAVAARVDDLVSFEVRDACELDLKRGWNAWVVSNLPFGQRVGGDADLDRLYRRFGTFLRERAGGYTATLLTTRYPRIQELGLQGTEERALVNGGLDCRILRLRLPG